MDVVTDVDREAKRELVRVIRAARPLDSIRAEEGTCIEGSSGLSWVLDPLDGTVLNFILNASSKGSENVLMDLPDKHPGYTHMALAVTDLGAVQVALESQDIRITEGPVEFSGARALFVRDPDGNVIEFNQSVPEA